MSKLDFLTEDEGSEARDDAEELTPVESPETETPTEQALEPQAEPETPAEPAPTAATREEAQVPLSALLAVRDEVRDLKAKLNQPQAAPQPTQPQAEEPVLYADSTPAEIAQYLAFHDQRRAEAALSDRLDLSEELARDKFGDETVDQVQAWVAQKYAENPAFRQEVLSQRNPYSYAVKRYQQDQLLQQVQDPTELDQFRAWKAAQAAGAMTQTAAPAASPHRTAPATPPRSLASAPSAGGLATQVVDEDEGTVFAKKG